MDRLGKVGESGSRFEELLALISGNQAMGGWGELLRSQYSGGTDPRNRYDPHGPFSDFSPYNALNELNLQRNLVQYPPPLPPEPTPVAEPAPTAEPTPEGTPESFMKLLQMLMGRG